MVSYMKILLKFKLLLLILIICLLPKAIFSLDSDVQEISDYEKAVVAICHLKPDIKTIKGTGFIVTSTGLVVTADHVITDTQGRVIKKLFALRPTHPSVEVLQLTVVKRFREEPKGRDIAILKINSSPPPVNLPYISVGGKAETGDSILIVGFPLVFGKVYSWPLFRNGIIASTHYKIDSFPMLILDLSPAEGYSGSPVISLKTQKVIGVYKGHSKDRPQTNFSIANILKENDIQQLE